MLLSHFLINASFIIVNNCVDFTLGAGVEVNKVAGGVSGMGMDRIDGFGDRTSEGQTSREYGTVLQHGFWQEQEPGIGYRGWESRLLVIRR